MPSTIFLKIFLLFVGYQTVNGATCTTAATCQQTDYTLSTCTSGVCNCINSSFTAIRTGCALKLDKPVITADAGSTNQVILGRTFILTCNLVDGNTFEWYLGTTKLTSATTSTYTVLVAAVADAGSYTCKGTTEDGKLTSETSDAFKLEVLGTGGVTTSNIQPTISVPTTTVFTGAAVYLYCYNIPIGAQSTEVTYKVAGSTVTTPLTIDGTNAGKDVTCTIANGSGYTFSSGTSAAGKLPTLTTSISVTVTWGGQTVTEIDKGASATVAITCTTSPGNAYLGAVPTYEWLKDGTTVSGAAVSYTVAAGVSGVYTCKVTLGSAAAVTSSNKVTVTTTTDQLTTSAPKPVKGGRVVLTCGDVRDDDATYLWYFGTQKIGRQYDRKLQIDNVDTTDDGVYRCDIVKNEIILYSGSKTLITQTTIETPTVSASGCGTRFGEKGDYYLECYTQSETIGMTYEWTAKGAVSTTVTGKYYSLPTISTTDNGDYTCKAKFGSVTSLVSNTKTVVTTNPGLQCNYDYQCVAAKTGYSGTCDINDRCLCADGYSQKGEQCSSNGSVVFFSSIVLMIFSCAISKFF